MRHLLVLAALLLVTPAHAVTIDWVTVPGTGTPNVGDTQWDRCYGSVADTYLIGKYEVTNAQYAEFLNAVTATDSYSLYSTRMAESRSGGITQGGSDGSYSYTVKEGFANKPVNFVSFWDALRFANWLHNGQPSEAQNGMTTEDGAYTTTPDGIANNNIARGSRLAPGLQRKLVEQLRLKRREEALRDRVVPAISMTHFYRNLMRSGVSTTPGQPQVPPSLLATL
jgi:formylglycine-generating enzyme required for sulfatase activity